MVRDFLGVSELRKLQQGQFKAPFFPRGSPERQSHTGKSTRSQDSGCPNKPDIEFECLGTEGNQDLDGPAGEEKQRLMWKMIKGKI